MDVNELREALSDALTRIEALEDTVEELRYAGPVNTLAEDDYDDYLSGEWDAL